MHQFTDNVTSFFFLFFFSSWTVITWIVVIGSSLVMVIWIGIYSLFNSPDFNYEVVVLYGEVTFWATVSLTLVIAIGEAVSFFFFFYKHV